MAKHLQTGQKGENLAADFLTELGYQLLEQNWRHRKLEVDLIVKDKEVLVFVEVKTRSSDFFGQPESFVSPTKEKNLAEAAGAYMELIKHDWAIRFDVISVLVHTGAVPTITHIKDAFFPELG